MAARVWQPAPGAPEIHPALRGQLKFLLDRQLASQLGDGDASNHIYWVGSSYRSRGQGYRSQWSDTLDVVPCRGTEKFEKLKLTVFFESAHPEVLPDLRFPVERGSVSEEIEIAIDDVMETFDLSDYSSLRRLLDATLKGVKLPPPPASTQVQPVTAQRAQGSGAAKPMAPQVRAVAPALGLRGQAPAVRSRGALPEPESLPQQAQRSQQAQAAAEQPRQLEDASSLLKRRGPISNSSLPVQNRLQPPQEPFQQLVAEVSAVPTASAEKAKTENKQPIKEFLGEGTEASGQPEARRRRGRPRKTSNVFSDEDAQPRGQPGEPVQVLDEAASSANNSNPSLPKASSTSKQ